MTADASNHSDLSIHIAHDATTVELAAPAGLDAAAVDPRVVAARLQQLSVLVDRAVAENLAAFAASYTGKTSLRAVIAKAQSATRGEDGRVEWSPGFDPTKSSEQESAPASGSGARIDHYAGKSYIAVKVGTVIGRLIEPTIGTPGRDVKGGDLLERGSACPFRFDDTITRDAQGTLTARIDGILLLEHQQVTVCKSLRIPEYVDFNTGHVNFPADVHVAQGVRAGFKVHAGGSLTIDGLVESTEISCDGVLALRAGMAGKGQGAILVAGDANVGYLEAVSGTFKQSLTVEREVGDCKLIIGGDLRASNASIFGGEIAVTGSCLVKVLGSEAGTPTRIILGDVPLLQTSRRELAKDLEQIDTSVRALEEQIRIIKLNPRPSASEKEKLTEFAFEMSELQRQRMPKALALSEIERVYASKRRLDVQIGKLIHRQVTLQIGDYTVLFRTEVKGPVSIFWDTNQHLLCKLGSADSKPLGSIASVQREVNSSKPSKLAA